MRILTLHQSERPQNWSSCSNNYSRKTYQKLMYSFKYPIMSQFQKNQQQCKYSHAKLLITCKGIGAIVSRLNTPKRKHKCMHSWLMQMKMKVSCASSKFHAFTISSLFTNQQRLNTEHSTHSIPLV